jgi:uncharacterized delta-60 repeat protein
MAAVVASLGTALVLAVGSGSAEAYRYVPDPTFGTGGVLNLLAGNGAGGVLREAREVKPGPGGTVYVLYRELPGPEMYECETKRYLARYLPSGALDPGFGSGGVVEVVAPLGCHYPALAVDEQFRPLLTWTSVGSSREPSSTTAITRFTSAGALDPGFGSGGVAQLAIPCPAGNSVRVHADAGGRLVLDFGCRADEYAGGEPKAPFQTYMARLQPNGALDTGFGGAGFVPLPLEAGWWPPFVWAVEPDGAAILAQATPYVEGVPQRMRLLRVRPDGILAYRYQARVEQSLRRVAVLGAPRIPEEVTDSVPRPGGGLVISGRADRGGWVMALRHDGSLDREFSGDGYRRFATPIRYIAADRRSGLFVLGAEYRRLTFYRLLADGDRDRSVGGPRGQQVGDPSTGLLADLVSVSRGRPLLYFKNLGSCSGPQDCAEPAELRRFRLPPKKR